MPENTKAKEPTTIKEVLLERGKIYGKFADRALIAQELKRSMRVFPGWQRLDVSQREALDMIQHKISRILNGDPKYVDSWVDIEGYAHLVTEELQKLNADLGVL